MLEITASPKTHTIGSEAVKLSTLLNGFEVLRATISSPATNTGSIALALEGSEIALLPGESLELGGAASLYTVSAQADGSQIEVAYVREVAS